MLSEPVRAERPVWAERVDTEERGSGAGWVRPATMPTAPNRTLGQLLVARRMSGHPKT